MAEPVRDLVRLPTRRRRGRLPRARRQAPPRPRSGVKAIDAGDWSVETLDLAASAFAVVAGRLLVFGGPHGSRTGAGLDRYDRSGERIFELLGDRHPRVAGLPAWSSAAPGLE